MLKITIFSFCILFAAQSRISTQSLQHTTVIVYESLVNSDSLPPLHTLQEKDISSVSTNFENQTITVTLKNDTTYTYEHMDWDFEDSYSSLNQRLREAIKSISMTFTKSEKAPEFPGGSEAWDKFVNDFSLQHEKQIRKEGPIEFYIQCIIHLRGQIENLDIIGNYTNPKLQKLFLEWVKNGPAWEPAMQNGRKVVSYAKQKVRLAL